MLLKKQTQCLFCCHTVLPVFKTTTILFEDDSFEEFIHFKKPWVRNAADTLIKGWWDFFFSSHASPCDGSWIQAWTPGLGDAAAPLCISNNSDSAGILKSPSARRAFFFSLSRRLQHHVVLELQPRALARDRIAARDLEPCWFPLYFFGLRYLIKEVISFLARDQSFALLQHFSLPNHFTNIKRCILTTDLQGAVDFFHLNFIVVFKLANRKLISHQIFIFWPSD